MPEKLGQNFLTDNSVVNDIINSSELKSDEVVLEIGPGRGIMTEQLAKHCKKVIAIELDKNLVEFLENKFKNIENVEIIHGDILSINLTELLGENTEYKLIANIPYYITSKIIRLFLEINSPPKEMILMIQKEVAERITASPGKMSKLAISVQYYARPEILFYVEKEKFNPAPKVDSAVIKIKPFAKGNKHIEEETKNFFKLVRAGFCARRKTLRNNLSNSLHLDKKEVEEKLKAADISPTARAQDLSVERWKKLSRLF